MGSVERNTMHHQRQRMRRPVRRWVGATSRGRAISWSEGTRRRRRRRPEARSLPRQQMYHRSTHHHRRPPTTRLRWPRLLLPSARRTTPRLAGGLATMIRHRRCSEEPSDPRPLRRRTRPGRLRPFARFSGGRNVVVVLAAEIDRAAAIRRRASSSSRRHSTSFHCRSGRVVVSVVPFR